MNNPHEPEKSRQVESPEGARPRRAPSARVTAALAAATLALGIAVGAAIGPAPTPSFAVGQLLPQLLPSLLRAREGATPSAVAPPPVTAQATPTSEAEPGTHRKRRHRKRKAGSGEAAASETPSTTETTTTPSSTPKGSGKIKTAKLPPVSKVWLIELAGASFSGAGEHTTAAPYLTGTAEPMGTLLSGWSALEASAFANDAALIAGSSPQLLDTIVQPPCPEGAAGAACAAGTPGALTTADEFLKATLPTIAASAAYRENGLVVVTFATVASASATGLPAGASTATLTSQPPAGALLISPFVAVGASSSAALNTTSPKQSLEKLLRR
ncbi:MAG TPA: hypothetical protein VGY13_02630 [Solirubrobacteraceae bacterium]|jgi:hypothetical protein|nr:hypothetical protein [Solirubrobacteraceae bacterium]